MGLVIGLVIVAALLLFRNRRPRRLRIELLWIRPVIFVVIVALALFAAPPPLTPISLGLLALGLILGGALGWQRGRFMRIDIDPETHAISVRASPAGLFFIVILLALRQELAAVMRDNALTLHVPLNAVIDAFVLLSGAMMIVQGLEMWMRARRLLAEARAKPVVSTF
jgi:hypothetical protein